MPSQLTVFGWHNVESTWCFPVTGSGVSGLERQLRQLRRYANVVPLEQALDALREGRPLPPRAVALCWDDGYHDNLRLAVPVLEKLGLPGTFFLVPGLLSRESRAWWEVAGWAFARSSRDRVEWRGMRLFTRGQAGRLCYGKASDVLRVMSADAREEALADLLDRLAPEGHPGDEDLFLDWNDAHELIRRGFSVGSHTMRHVTLAQESPEAQLADLRLSRERLEGELDVPIRTVAYPFGQSDAVSEATREATLAAGYAHGLTTEFGWNTGTTPAAHGRRVMLDPHIGFVATLAGRVAGRLRTDRDR
ncbi:Polysaccharide deacetylase [Sinosporangium album]|uniref:Polysaccharide deacetylase n=1 Tax=Sinosporangium album TaxID=504805 RepID=A0A1G7UFG2_9ACTN|nr:polysaccharide deacetylase family protein [Sinosporangium album]SDG45510.1 Polysaccharide deacetylase [Sinosporangium album]